jgi:hypothetical protein
MKPNKTYNLLVEDRQSDPSTIAVIKDVDLSDHKTLRDKLTLVLTEHYDADTIIKQIPEYIQDQYFPSWSVSYETEGSDDKWKGEIEISCVHIY